MRSLFNRSTGDINRTTNLCYNVTSQNAPRDFIDKIYSKGTKKNSKLRVPFLAFRLTYVSYSSTSSEVVSEALLPIYNQLLTLRKCLIEVKKSGGVSSPRELYPYSIKLNAIDNMRVDGKFIGGYDIPNGQVALTSLIGECFDIACELENEAGIYNEAEETDKETKAMQAQSKLVSAGASHVQKFPQATGHTAKDQLHVAKARNTDPFARHFPRKGFCSKLDNGGRMQMSYTMSRDMTDNAKAWKKDLLCAVSGTSRHRFGSG